MLRSSQRDAANISTRGLVFCDFSSFYSPTAGGVRTYHDAKLAWFAAQRRHRYVLIYPSHGFSVSHPAPTVTVVTAYGLAIRAGYRLPIDVARIRSVIRGLQPDVLETGDPWFSGPLALWFRESGDVSGPVSSFFHCDPLPTYVRPWVDRATRSRDFRLKLSDRAYAWFYRAQQLYDLTLASSMHVERDLRSRGIRNVVCVPFGVDPLFLQVGRRRRTSVLRKTGPRRLLYVGRLQADKGVDVLLEAVPELLRRPDVSLTIAGTGPYAPAVTRLAHPRVQYLGYIVSRETLSEVYAQHDVLIAPGRYETFGLTVLEGLAAGLTVVGPDAGGTGELMGQLESPCFFDSKSGASLVLAVERALDGDLNGRTIEAVELAERYGSWNDAVAREVDRYCEFLSRSTM
jgi:alpha-1,6-mannosyltransferase